MNERRRDDPRATPADDHQPPAAWWRLPLLLAIVLLAIIAARSWHDRARGPTSPTAARPQPATEATGESVSLTIRFDDGAEREFAAVAWRPEMTVNDLLMAISQQPDSISYSVVGEREMTMVTKIDDAANDTATGRFWTYSVNGEPADRSSGIYVLRPGDRVLWTFGNQQ